MKNIFKKALETVDAFMMEREQLCYLGIGDDEDDYSDDYDGSGTEHYSQHDLYGSDTGIVIISGGSGTGKDSVIKEVTRMYNRFECVISYTTRKARADEVNGKDYYFVSNEAFAHARAKGIFAESITGIAGENYGTPWFEIERIRALKRIPVVNCDTTGMRKLTKLFPNAVTIFLLPPGMNALRERLNARNAESASERAMRLKDARKQFSFAHQYDFVLINDDLRKTIEDVSAILHSLELRISRDAALRELHSWIDQTDTDNGHEQHLPE